ncbi:MAG: DoxX family protein [Candidatus Schekmanbacteria bacterium RIFCSPHIGHO2_02_FULL_38_11]|nr:MAG: DoxX family protein [Candidatus Schekmanbacteria bacterium GWA2_38_9]OGL49839.1 MAG: DoxX family protein [Candidatus Schekmanbacteria bacterium RIFCSPHIGHO2_02_FULL_38_11]
MQKIIPLIGRILISQIFLASGFEKIMNFEGTQKYMASFGMPFTAFFAICAIVLEIGGGLSVLLGYKARIGAVLLVVFLIPTTLIFHTNFADQMQVIQFMKNLAILGGLFVVAGFGAGSFSFDKN